MDWLTTLGHRLVCATPYSGPASYPVNDAQRAALQAWKAGCGWWNTLEAYFLISLVVFAVALMLAGYLTGRVDDINPVRLKSQQVDVFLSWAVGGTVVALLWAFLLPVVVVGGLTYLPARGMFFAGRRRTQSINARRQQLAERERELKAAENELERDIAQLRAGRIPARHTHRARSC